MDATPNTARPTVTITRSELNDIVRAANADKVDAHRAARRALLQARRSNPWR